MTPSAMRKVAARLWSATTFIETSVRAPSPSDTPERSWMASITGAIRSVSKIVETPCLSAATLSSPMPVSMFFLGSGTSEASPCLSYCMKTRFQSSRNLSQSQPGSQSGPQEYSLPRS